MGQTSKILTIFRLRRDCLNCGVTDICGRVLYRCFLNAEPEHAIELSMSASRLATPEDGRHRNLCHREVAKSA